MLGASAMLISSPSHVLSVLRSPRTIAAVVAGAMGVGAYWWYTATRVVPTPEEIETARREYLANSGRIVDGSITETRWAEDDPVLTPQTLIYSYSIGGVTYECAQDVTPLAEYVRHVRTDLPIQVRFDPRNPGDSIVVAESWSGLRMADQRMVGRHSVETA